MDAQVEKDLLRQFEPVVRYTAGEHFFPFSAETYLQDCSLWVQRGAGAPECLLHEGEVTLDSLANVEHEGFSSVYYLQFIEPLNLAQLATYRIRQALERQDRLQYFRAGRGRLARVGYLSRFVDALFSISLLARGRVPGDTAAAAALTYGEMRRRDERYSYYGRVLHRGSWIVLQYWYLYAFNDWRSRFFGANDHEADWEMVNIYLYESEPGKYCPEWVAYASHDYSGDDLRRRWDDPELEKIGDHPVVYAGAGSHASYFAPGEYLTQVSLPFMKPVERLLRYLEKVWKRMLRQTQVAEEYEIHEQGKKSQFGMFRIPFVDYARGDGLAIGEGGDRPWDEPTYVNPTPAWVRNYRGLWGYYARDPVAGENAPAGMRYNRDGSVRRAWYDPLGWAGMDKVLPPPEAHRAVLERVEQLEQERKALEKLIEEQEKTLLAMNLDLNAMRGHPHFRSNFGAQEEAIQELSGELAQARSAHSGKITLLEAYERHLEQTRRGHAGPMRAHIENPMQPETEVNARFNRLAEAWAALSIGVLMITFVALALFARQHLFFGLLIAVATMVVLEAAFRRRLSRLINRVTVVLALAAALVLLIEFFWTLAILVVLVVGGYIITENLRELWKR